MSPPDSNNVKRSEIFTVTHTVNEEPLSSHSANSPLRESSTVVTRAFHSPVMALKKVFKPKGVSLVRRRGYLPSPEKTSELQLDNGQHLSGLMNIKPTMMDEIDQSFASDFDESARWLKQIR